MPLVRNYVVTFCFRRSKPEVGTDRVAET